MFSRLKGFMGMSSMAAVDDTGGISAQRKPHRRNRDTQEMEAHSVALKERIRTRTTRVSELVNDLGDESSETAESGPAILYPEMKPTPSDFVAIVPREPIGAIHMSVDFVVRTRARAVVKGRVGDWLVRFPDGDYAVYPDKDFRRTFKQL